MTSLALSHDVLRSDTRNEIVTATASEKGIVSGTEIVSVIAVTASVVSAAIETVNVNGIVTASASENESVVEEMKKEHGAAADGKNANALAITNENAAVGAMLARLAIVRMPATNHPEKYSDGEAATVTVGSDANETKEQQQTWPLTNMKAVCGLHPLWEYHLPRLLRPRLFREVPRMNDDGAAVVVSVTASATGTVRETVTMAAVAAVVEAIASVDEAEMTDMLREEAAEECGWAMRTSGLVGGCKHILIFLVCYLTRSLIDLFCFFISTMYA